MKLRAFILSLMVVSLGHVSPAVYAGRVPVPAVPPLEDRPALTIAEYEAFAAMANYAAGGVAIPRLSFTGNTATPGVGSTTSYGVTVTADLAAAFDAHMRGDGPAALAALDAAEAAAGGSARSLFEISMLRAQIHIMTGRSDAAEAETARAEAYEIQTFNTNVNSRALRGEARLWAGDFEFAINDLAQVAVATRDWRLPTSYDSPPTNMGEMFNMTTAQLRAGALAATYVLLEDFAAALPWASRAEVAADVFTVATHPMYGSFVPFHADSYYGRALNLAVLGAARLIVNGDRNAAEMAVASAHELLDDAGFVTPKITVDMLYAQALFETGFQDAAETIAGAAGLDAARLGLPDMVWRIEALRGEALYADNRDEEAEIAFRRAQAAIELVSGALATDQAKRRFGIDKEGVTNRLVEFGLARGDLAAVFRDLERARARAFIDMLAGRLVAEGRQAELTQAIRDLDVEIRTLRLLAMSPTGATGEVGAAQDQLAARREEFTATLRRRDPEMADVLAISHYELDDIQAALGPGEILAYGLPSGDDEALRVLLIGRDEAAVRELGAGNRKISRTIRALRKAMKRDADAGKQKVIIDRLAGYLAIEQWGAETALYVVPSGQLFFIPWGVLELTTPVAVLPTGGWLKRASVSAGDLATVVVGDPQFFGDFPQLAGARAEARRIGGRYGVEPLLGDAATEARLRDKIGSGVRILHFATHALFDAANPLQSSLILSGDQAADRLTEEEIFQRPLSARLVVPSACETGAGEVAAGDDFLGLPRSFYLGGATTVVYSLWPVSDVGTMAFMEAFHEELASGDVGASWLAARDRLAADGYPPLVYGAFVLGGSLKL